MRVDIQVKIRGNNYYQNFIREYPIWYKYLNRYPELFSEFEQQAKKRYKLTVSDKISSISDQIDFVRQIIDIAN